MKKKVYVVLSLYALTMSGHLFAQMPPPPPSWQVTTVPRSSTNNKKPQQVVVAQPQEQDEDLNAVVDYAVDYVKDIGSRTAQFFGFSTSDKEKAQSQLYNTRNQVEKDTIALLSATDRQEWQRYIKRELEKNPEALAETLLPLEKFNSKDAAFLSNYIIEQKDQQQEEEPTLRTVLRPVVNPVFYQAAQQEMANDIGDQKFLDTPEAQEVKKQLTENVKDSAKKHANKFLEVGKQKAEKKVDSYFDAVRQRLLGR